MYHYNSSKNEKEIRDKFKKMFPEDNWKSKAIYYNGRKLVPDLISHGEKVVIEYDRPWHFKQMWGNHNIRKQYLRDKLLEEWCIKDDYKLIRIDAKRYKKNKKASLQNLIEAAYEKNEDVIKIGDKY